MKWFALVLFLAGLLRAVAQERNEAMDALVQVLAQSDDSQLQYDILKGMSDGLKGRRNVPMPVGWEELSAKLAQSSNTPVRELSQSLSVAFGSKSALNLLRLQLNNGKESLSTRTNALNALLQARDPQLPATLQGLLKDEQLRRAALRALANYDDLKTPGIILEQYPRFTGVEKQEALNTLVSRAAFARPLLSAVAREQVSRKDLTADIVRQLRSLKDPEINSQVQKLWGVARESQADKLAQIARYKTMLLKKGTGSPSRGRAIFAKTCQQCHTLFDTGGKVGPDITGSNRGDLDYILQNVIDPNAVIPNDYRTSTLETKDDRVITGIVTRQDDNAVTIVIPGETLVIGRKDIQSLTQGDVSMMPEGLLDALNETEVRDLVAYLKSPAQVPLP
jgi:putative heme-binding domain-containing protein